MAQRVTTVLIDDLDGVTINDVTTVPFSLDGVTYEIELGRANAERLRANLQEFVGHARLVGGKKPGTRHVTPRATSQLAPGVDRAVVRQWALDNGLKVARNGAVPAHVLRAYEAAHPSGSTPSAREATPGKSAAGGRPGKSGRSATGGGPAKPAARGGASAKTKRGRA